MLLGPFTNLSFVLSRHVHWCNASAKCASTENFPQPMTLPSSRPSWLCSPARRAARNHLGLFRHWITRRRSEEHTSELQSPDHLVCRLLLEKKKKKKSEQQYVLLLSEK